MHWWYVFLAPVLIFSFASLVFLWDSTLRFFRWLRLPRCPECHKKRALGVDGLCRWCWEEIAKTDIQLENGKIFVGALGLQYLEEQAGFISIPPYPKDREMSHDNLCCHGIAGKINGMPVHLRKEATP